MTKTDKTTPRKLKAIDALKLSIIGLAACFLLSFTASFLWIGELLVHFISQYVWISALLLCFALYVRNIPYSIGAGLITLASLSLILWTNAHSAVFAKDGVYSASFSLASYNKYYGNANAKRITSWLKQEDAPDIVVIHEIELGEVDQLIKDNPDYAYSALMNGTKYPRNRSLVLSRFPIKNAKSIRFEAKATGATREYLKASVTPPAKAGLPAFTLFVMHPKTPLYPKNRHIRNAEFEQVGKDAAETTGPIVIAADLNCTPFSPAFQKMVGMAGLRFVSSSLIPKPTWPAPFIIEPLQIRIDHVLISDDLVPAELKRLNPMGSDHYPLTVRLHPAAQ